MRWQVRAIVRALPAARQGGACMGRGKLAALRRVGGPSDGMGA